VVIGKRFSRGEILRSEMMRVEIAGREIFNTKAQIKRICKARRGGLIVW